MAVTSREGKVGTFVTTETTTDKFAGIKIGTSELSSGGDLYGTLLDFSNVSYKGGIASGTYSTFQDTAEQINAAKNLLSDTNAASLADINTVLSSGSLSSMGSTNKSFFSTFFNYYLGLAQERQANLTKNLGRSNLLESSGSLL